MDEMDSILNDISDKLDRLIARLLQPFPASSRHCDKLSNVVSASASDSLNELDEKANLDIDVSCQVADRVVGEIGGKFACNTAELQGDKVAPQLFDEMPEKNLNSYIAYSDLGKSTIIASIMAATDLVPRKVVGEGQMTYNHKNESKRGIAITSTRICPSYEILDESLKNFKLGRSRKEYLTNLIDFLGHMDFSSKVDATLCVTASAFVGVNGVEGIRVQTRRKKSIIFDPGGELIYVSSFLFAVDLKSWNYSWDDSLVQYDYDDVVRNLEYMVEAREQVDGETGEKTACNWSGFQVTEVAFELFDKMPKRDLVSSNAQLCGEFEHLEWRNQVYQQAFFQDFVEQMKIRRNLNIPGQFGKKALRTSQISAKKTALVDLTLVPGKIYDGGGFICIKECFDEDTSHLIVLLSDGDVHYRLEQWQFLLKGEGEHGEKLVVATGEYFAGNLSEIQFGEVACQLFAEMHERVYITHITLIGNCTMNRRYDDSLVVFGLVKAMMDMYGWCNELCESHRLCVVMDQRDAVYWNIWFFGCACAKLNVIIMNLCYLLRAQGDEDAKPTKISIDVVFSACMNMCWESGQLICASAIQMGLEFWPSVRTAFFYAKYCSVSHEAQNVFQHIVCKDVISWNSIISGYINQEVCAKTFQILKQINFSSFSFCCLTHGIQHDGMILSDTSLGVGHDAFNMLFSEMGAKKHVLRVIFVNPEPVAINEVIIGIYDQQLLLQEQFISFKKDAASNLARVRKVLDTCMGLKGILVFNVGGGIEISLCYLLVKDWFMDYRKESELSLLNCKADDVQELKQTLLFRRRHNSSDLQCNRMYIKPLKKPWKDNSRVQTTKLLIERHQKKLFNFTTSSTKAMALEEFLILNVGASSFEEAMTMSVEVYHYFEAAIKNMESCSLPNNFLPLGVLHNWTRFSIEAGGSLSFGENLPTLNQAHFSSDLEDKVKFDGGSNVMTHRDWYFPMRNDPKAGRQGTIKGKARAAMGDIEEEGRRIFGPGWFSGGLLRRSGRREAIPIYITYFSSHK